jgi:hypothetical protein
LIVKENAFVTVAEASSVTWNVMLEVPAVVGVPPITPVADKLRPAGSVPEDTHQLYGAVPPVAASIWLYAVPTVPAGREAVVIERATAAGLIVKVNAFVDETPLAVTWTVKLEVAAVVGVPPRTPVEEFRVRPAGSVPPDTVQDLVPVPPVAANVWLYAVPTVPAGNGLAVVIEGATATGGSLGSPGNVIPLISVTLMMPSPSESSDSTFVSLVVIATADPNDRMA